MTFTRRMDDLGRIVIPKEMREAMGIKEGEEFVLNSTYDGAIIVEKFKPTPPDAVTVNMPKDRKMYVIRWDGGTDNIVLLTEDQIRLLDWLCDRDYLNECVFYDEYVAQEFEVI